MNGLLNFANFSMKLFAKMFVIVVATISLNSCRTEKENHNSKRPNILVLISDDQRWDQLSCANNPLIPELKTPNIDRLARQGVYFRNAFVTTPICAVSRASILKAFTRPITA